MLPLPQEGGPRRSRVSQSSPACLPRESSPPESSRHGAGCAGSGAGCTGGGATGAVLTEGIHVPCRGRCGRLRLPCGACVGCEPPAGVSCCPALRGSDERPMCWLDRRLAARDTAVATTSPSSARPIHEAVRQTRALGDRRCMPLTPVPRIAGRPPASWRCPPGRQCRCPADGSGTER
jgi:hypothetical protein